jgi:hypothetical protein
MGKVRVLAGTRKGAFILTSDEARKNWDISGPFFGGWEVYHMSGSPVDPDRLYASQTSAWFGQIIQRSDDGGRTWMQPGTPPGEATTTPQGFPKAESNKFVYDTSAETGAPLTSHMWYDGSPHPWEFKRVWHLEPSWEDRDTVYAGVEDAALFKSTDGGKNWFELAGLRGHGGGEHWMPGAGGMGLHTILLYSKYMPDPTADIGHCVHRITMHPLKPEVLYMQKHWDVMRSDNAGEQWHKVSGNLPCDFGFPIAVHSHDPDTIYVVPIKSDSEHYPPEGKLRVYRSKKGGDEWEALTNGLPQENCYVNVLRDAMAVDTLDDCGIYFGTTGGQIYCSPDSGDNWIAIARDLPAVLSVEVQTLA